MKKWKEKQEELLKVLYAGEDYTLADKLLAELYEKWRPFAQNSGSPLTQKDCMLITYGDALREEGKDPLEARMRSPMCTCFRYFPIPPTTDSQYQIIPG